MGYFVSPPYQAHKLLSTTPSHTLPFIDAPRSALTQGLIAAHLSLNLSLNHRDGLSGGSLGGL